MSGERVLAFSGLESVTILRFGIVYGPREKNWSAVENLLEKVRRGENVQVGSLKTARRFIHVDDLCVGIMAALDQRGLQVFNLSGDRQISLGEVLKTSQKVLGKCVEVSEKCRKKSVSAIPTAAGPPKCSAAPVRVVRGRYARIGRVPEQESFG